VIDEIKLRNILAFRSTDLPLRGLTLLAGTNSAGKSSVLHALALLRQSAEARVLDSAWMLNGEIVELGTGRDLLHADPDDVAGVTGIGLAIALREGAALRTWSAAYNVDADVLDVVADEPEASDPLFALGFQYLRADRIVPTVTYPKSHEAASVRGWLGARGEHAPNFLRVHGGHPAQCVQARLPDTIGTGLLDQTNAWLNVLSPGTVVGVEDVPGTDFVRLLFSRTGPDVKTEPHRSTNVGFGLTYALPVIVACLSAQPGSLVLVENPEAHLHPAGQAAIGRLCALASEGGAQVIVETHSDHVLNAVRLAVRRQDVRADNVLVHFFTRKSGVLQPDIETLEIAADGMLPYWPAGFFDQWDRALDELLG
jgi:predicted ATPase